MFSYFKTLYAKVTVSIFTLCIFACIVGSSFIYYAGKEIVERSAGASFYALAQLTSSKLELLIEHHLEESTIFARSAAIMEVVKNSNAEYGAMDKALRETIISTNEKKWLTNTLDKQEKLDVKASTFITEYEKSTAEFLSAFDNPYTAKKEQIHKTIYITNERGVVVAGTAPPAHFYFGNDEEWLRGYNFKEGRSTLSDIYFDTYYKTHVFLIQVPIKEFGADGGRTIGLVHMVHNAGPFFRWVTSIKTGRTDHTMLVRSDGTILFCPLFPIKTHKLDKGVSLDMTTRKDGWFSSKKDIHFADIGEAINGFAMVPVSADLSAGNFNGQQLFIFTSQNPDETFQPLYDFLKFVGAIGVIGAFIFTLIGLLASRRLVGPIVDLKDSARRIGDGNYDHWIGIHREDEVGELAIEFNRMAKKLKNSYTGLEQLSKMKSEFVSKVSHELRTPLTSIGGFAEILLEHDDITPATQKEFLTIINSESARLARLINDVLDLSRIESGKFVWRMKVLNMGSMLESAVAIMRSQANEKGLELTLEVEDNLSSVLGDRDQIMQVLENLLGNAIKFTKLGYVKIIAKHYGDNFIHVSVNDTGVGIASGDIENIFNTFFQAGSVITGELKGTGLGLSISKEIVTYLGGEIWCESELKKGSSFIFTLPVAKEKSSLLNKKR